MKYEVVYNPLGGNQRKMTFKSYERAEKFAKDVLSNGASDIFLETLANDGTLKEEKMYTVHGVMTT